MDQHTGVVCQIPCSSTTSVNIGGALQNGEVDASALAEHVQSIGHRVDLSKTEVTEPGQGNAA